MNIGISTALPQYVKTVILPLSQDGLEKLEPQSIKAAFGLSHVPFPKDFKGELGEVQLVYGPDNLKVVFLGLGKDLAFAKVLRAFRILSKKNTKLLSSQLALDLKLGSLQATQAELVEAAVNGLCLGTYQVGRFKTEEAESHPLAALDAYLHLSAEENADLLNAAKSGQAFAETQMSIMDLVNAPSNKKNPEDLGAWALRSGKEWDIKVDVWDKEKITEEGMDGLLAVNQGSYHPAVFIIMDYQPPGGKAEKTIGLVGKGVTFDTGGLSLKPSAGMPLMKSDMGGAAAVLGTVEMAAKLQLPYRVIGIVPSTDNSVGSNAFKPSDVIGSYSGKTIEIIDTDAEGRLILADGLSYMARQYQPDIMLDLATLTGSTVRTFGYVAAGLFTKNESLREALFQSGIKVGERLWPLPMWDEYHEEMQSDIADIKNLATKPMAGGITAAKFLEFFTDEHPKWAHLDIAGVAFSEAEFSKQKSATGYGVRLLIHFLNSLKDNPI
jgi:leucyl aminopeptidase